MSLEGCYSFETFLLIDILKQESKYKMNNAKFVRNKKIDGKQQMKQGFGN